MYQSMSAFGSIKVTIIAVFYNLGTAKLHNNASNKHSATLSPILSHVFWLCEIYHCGHALIMDMNIMIIWGF